MIAQIREEAAEWLIEFRMEEADAAAREGFAAWLASSPEHVRAYLEAVAIWEDAGVCAQSLAIDIDALIALARAESNVVGLGSAARADRRASGSMPPEKLTSADFPARARRRLRLAAAAVVATLGVALGAWYGLERAPDYATALGEQRSVRLPDGSSVLLNALSRVRVHFTEHERSVDLLEGQALFRVARDKARPFVVASGDTYIRAVGTQFDVSRKRSGTVVTVLEGRVAVVHAGGSERIVSSDGAAVSSLAVEMSAGERLAVKEDATPKPERANVATATAWTQQQLIFDSTPLPDVAEEFNRFNPQHLVIESPALASFNVSGTFPALDPTSLPRFLRFLKAQPGIHVAESGDRIVVTTD